LQLVCERLEWDVGEIWSLDSEQGRPSLVGVWTHPSLDLSARHQSRQALAIPTGLDRAEDQPGPVWTADIAADPLLARAGEAQGIEWHGMVRLPIAVHGTIRAVLRVACREVRQRDDAALTRMSSVGVLIGRFLERQDSRAQQRDSARKADLFEGALDALLTIDRSGIVVDFNSAASELFRYRREQALGHELLGLIVPARLREQVLAEVTRFRATGKSSWIGQRFDAVVMRSDGSEFPAEVGLALVGTESGSLLVIRASDASARQQSQLTVQRSQERLRALMTAAC
jgi:PAS domain S-box-containing protein